MTTGRAFRGRSQRKKPLKKKPYSHLCFSLLDDLGVDGSYDAETAAAEFCLTFCGVSCFRGFFLTLS